jgi:hypothetical protein
VDFVTMTCVSLALYAVYTPATVRRRFFRTVVAMIFLSLVYDMLYSLMVDASSNAELDGGYEDWFFKLSSMFSYISFMFKVSALF